MFTLRLVRADEPQEALENVNLRRMLECLTRGTHDQQRGFVLLPSEAQALYSVLALRTFSLEQLDQVEEVIRELDPQKDGSRWNDHTLMSFVDGMRQHLDRPHWVDQPIRSLHREMRSQGSDARFRLWLCRAALVAFLTVDHLFIDSEEFSRLTG